MPIPKIKKPKYVKTEQSKMHDIKIILCEQDYIIKSVLDIVHIIENEHLDKSQFDFPYGSFEAFKEHVLAGDFDVDVEKILKEHQYGFDMNTHTATGELWRR